MPFSLAHGSSWGLRGAGESRPLQVAANMIEASPKKPLRRGCSVRGGRKKLCMDIPSDLWWTKWAQMMKAAHTHDFLFSMTFEHGQMSESYKITKNINDLSFYH